MSNNPDPNATPSVPSVSDLFDTAQQSGGIGAAAKKVLIANLNGYTARGAAGPTAKSLSTTSVTIVLDLIDRSGSMVPFQQAVIDAINLKKQAFLKSKSAGSIIMSSWFFDSKPELWYSYQRLESVPDLTAQLYDPNGGTALNDTFLDSMIGLVSYVTTLQKTGTDVTVLVWAYTDGDDTASQRTASAVKTVIDDLMLKEIYTFVMVAFGHGFARNVAGPLGIKNVIESSATEHDIRATVDFVSQSVLQVSTGKIDPNSIGQQP